ncbi:MAG: SDR family oxidoreductase [Candidatus Gastranaerophilales bacterium]|nr:SDR family oxidoreductase [Candidatus Gastranaerophilales bacterium]
MEISFENKIALVTGAAGGIGFITAKMFAQSGAKVVLADINEELLTKSTYELKKQGFSVTCFKCNVAKEDDVISLINRVVETYGRLDIAYNNVGIHAKVKDKMANTERSDFDDVIAVNLGGVWNCMKYEILEMQKQGGGRIVNCSSQSGLVGIAGVSAYTASKHAILGLTKAAALEYARDNIRINAICPGTSETPMVEAAIKMAPEHMAKVIDDIPLGRMGKAEEIASAVLWLCSDYAGFAIGQTFAIDGGYTTI